MTSIIYLHGFASVGDSEKSQSIRKRFPNCKVYSPNFSPMCMDEVFKLLYAEPHDDYVFVGTSLGGFWANVFAHLTNSKAVIVNPSITPSQSLPRYPVLNHVTKQMVKIDESDFAQITGAENLLARIYDGKHIHLFVAKDDAVIPYEMTLFTLRNPASVTITDDGGHRYAMHWDKVLDKVAELI
jgi:predicted esterase YcpF (UPF0227 family)